MVSAPENAKMHICEDCGEETFIGAWPFCHGQPGKHVEARPGSAFFEPIVVFRDAKGRIRVPGNSNAKPPKGWQREEINTRRQAEAISKDVSNRDRAKWAELRQREAAFFERDMAKNRAEVSEMYHNISDPKVREFIDIAMRRGDESDRRSNSYNPGVYFQVLE